MSNDVICKGGVKRKEQEMRGLRAQLAATQKELEHAKQVKEKMQCSMGVGIGDGKLFVYGDYESIKAVQKIVLRKEQTEAELADSNNEIKRCVAFIEGQREVIRQYKAENAALRERFAGIESFIYHLTLDIQKHRELTDSQKDAIFQRAYEWYVKLDVENTREEKL